MFSLPCCAADLAEASRELVRKLLPGGAAESVTLTVRNAGSASVQPEILRGAIQTAIPAQGSQVVEQSPSVELTVTMSQSPVTSILVGEAKRGDERTVAMIPVQLAAAASTAARTTISSTQIWEQDAPFLDIATIGNVTLVLEPGRIAAYEQGKLQTALPISGDHPWPRDVRGRLRVDGTSFTAWLPGIMCQGQVQPLSMECENSSAPWSIAPGISGAFVATRNYFDGTLEGGRRTAPFYSAALIDNRLIAAGTDGLARVYAASTDSTASWSEWGDDIAGVSSACGRHILSAQDRSVRAYEIIQDKPVGAGNAVELSGRIAALWEATDGRQATAILRDDSSGRHAAFSLSITCSR